MEENARCGLTSVVDSYCGGQGLMWTLMASVIEEHIGWTNCHEQTHLEVGWGERDGVRMVNMKASEVPVGSQVPPRGRAFYIKVDGHVPKPYWKSETTGKADISCSDKDQAHGSWCVSWTPVVTWWVGVWVVVLRVQLGATSAWMMGLTGSQNYISRHWKTDISAGLQLFSPFSSFK